MDLSVFKGELNGIGRKEERKERAELLVLPTIYPMKHSSLEDPLESGSMLGSFRDLLEGEKSLKKYIEDRLKEKRGLAVGVEFGGDGESVFRDFSKNFFHKSVGVCLERYANTPNDISMLTNFNGSDTTHYILTGDMFTEEVYEKLASDIGVKKVDLILERMAAGLLTVSEIPLDNIKIFKKWYEMLNVGGLMFVQVPNEFGDILKRWVDFVKKNHKETLSVGCADDGCGFGVKVVRVHKLNSGAPDKLPLFENN